MMNAAQNQIVVSPDRWMLNVSSHNDLSGISVHGNTVQVQRRAPQHFTYKFWNESYEIPGNFNFAQTSFVGEIISVVAKSVNPQHDENVGPDDDDLAVVDIQLGHFIDNIINIICAVCALFYVAIFFYCKWSAPVYWYIFRNLMRLVEFICVKIVGVNRDWFITGVKMRLFPVIFTVWMLICIFKPEAYFLDKYVFDYQDSLASMLVYWLKSLLPFRIVEKSV